MTMPMERMVDGILFNTILIYQKKKKKKKKMVDGNQSNIVDILELVKKWPRTKSTI